MTLRQRQVGRIAWSGLALVLLLTGCTGLTARVAQEWTHAR